jgi:Fe-Mn family superoxide dismutase
LKKFILPELRYDYVALEPFISGKLLELHHTKHHNAYVSGANTAVEQIAQAREDDNTTSVNLLTKNYTFNLAGHVNHSAFWQNLTSPVKSLAAGQPGGTANETGGWENATGGPVGTLAEQIDTDFGGFERFKKQFTSAAAGVQGSGWVLLVWDALSGSLQIQQLHDHQAELALSLTPLVLLDVWEHAYYLDYLNVRVDYITAWWNIINWQDAQARFAEATRVI